MGREGGRVPPRAQTFFARIDSLVERLVLFRPSGPEARPWLGLSVVLMGLAFVFQLAARDLQDLYVFPVLVSAFVLRREGLMILPGSVFLYHLAGWIRGELPLRYLLLNDLVHLLEWGLLAGFVVVTLEKYTALRRIEGRIQSDLQLAKTLQTALTPSDFELGSVRIVGSIHQCDNVGGDFYYFRPFQKRYVLCCLGDVMGKGIASSLLMCMVMSFIFEWGKKSPNPEFLVKKLNRRLVRFLGEDSNFFITMTYAVFDEQSKSLRYATAGHQGGLLVRADGFVDQLDGEGIPLGIFMDAAFPSRELFLETGDRVLLFTDGVTEARGKNGELFGIERLIRLARSKAHCSSRRLVQAIESSVLEHTGGDYTDDLALLVFEVAPDGENPGVEGSSVV